MKEYKEIAEQYYESKEYEKVINSMIFDKKIFDEFERRQYKLFKERFIERNR